MDIQREFAARPPREELTTLSALVRDWTWRTEEKTLIRDPVMDWCVEARSFTEAAERACRSRGANGKMHNHQSRVTGKARRQLYNRIVRRIRPEHRGFKDFDDLYDTIEEMAPSGIGPVTIYDVAVRLSAYLGIEPTSLYLHAGVREGWNALSNSLSVGVKRIPRNFWPAPLRALPADEVEDFLCTYRSVLGDVAQS